MAVSPQAPALLREGLAFHQAGRLGEARRCYAQVRASHPKLAEAWQYDGMAALQLGDLVEAERLLARALELRPDVVDIMVPLASVLIARDTVEQARAMLERAVKLAPGHFLAWDKLAVALRALGRHEEAVAIHGKATNLAHSSPIVWASLGTTLEQCGRLLEAVDAYARAVQCGPSDSLALEGYANCLYKAGSLRKALSVHERLLSLNPRAWASQSQRLMALCADEMISSRELSDAHAAVGGLLSKSVTEQRIPSRPRGAPLRVGFLSSELWNHPVGRFLLPLLERADPAREILFLYFDSARSDSVTENLRATAASAHGVQGLSDAELEKLLRSHELDVLVELTGHGLGNRLPVIASRVAPVQVNYLGYPCTTGLRAMDYRLVDAVTDPESAADALSTEKLVRFAPTAWCFRAPADSPPPQRREGPLTFGCFNQAGKLQDGLLLQWAAILAAAPGSRLLLKGYGLNVPSFSEPLRRRLLEAGIPPSSVLLRGFTPSLAEHLACYQEIDVALDTFPYGGTTTTCEALWMGVPVVSLQGDRHAARVGASLLHAIGCDDWIANDWDSYRRIALNLANRDGQSPRGAALRERLQQSPLMDEAAQSTRFWQALHSIGPLRGSTTVSP